MVVVLSAFNGIEHLIDSRYSALDSDISIYPAYGKTFNLDTVPVQKIKSLQGLGKMSPVVEENVLASYNHKQRIVRIKGFLPDYLQGEKYDSLIIRGTGMLKQNGEDLAVLGAGVRYDLNTVVGDQSLFPLKLTAILRGRQIYKSRQRALNTQVIHCGGVFSINYDFDTQYILVPLEFAQKLLGYHNDANSIEVNLSGQNKEKNFSRAASELQNLLGKNYTVKTRYQKNEVIYKTNQSEKWIAFLILVFILLIATFNIIASLSMLILEKRGDVKVLSSMGMNTNRIRQIFFQEGLLINALGAGSGLLLGLVLCLAQEKYGFVPLHGGLVPYYPVRVMAQDLLVVFVVVVLIGLISSVVPVRLFTRKILQAKT